LIPFQPVVPLPDGSVLRIAAAELVAPLLLFAALVAPRRKPAPGLGLLALGIVLVAFFSTLLAATERPLTGYALGKTAGLFYVTAMGFALVRGLDAGAEPKLLRALGTGAFWSAMIGLVGFAAWIVGIPNSLVEGDRLCSTMPGDPNIYGSLLTIGILIESSDRERSVPMRVLRVGVLAVALIATSSRSAFVALVVGSLARGLLGSRDRWGSAVRGTYGLVAVGLVAALCLLTDPGQHALQMFWDRVSRTFTVDSRFDLYERAMAEFSDHPLLGLGIGGFHDLNTWGAAGNEHYAVHNTYLWALVDMGIAGGLLLTSLVLGAIIRCARAAAGAQTTNTAAVVGAALAAMAVFNLFIDGYYQRHFWILVACALGVPVLTPKRWVMAWPNRESARPRRSLGWVGVR
jgi:O-antigen ligase